MWSPIQIFQNLPWWAKVLSIFIAIVFGISIVDLIRNRPDTLNSLISQQSNNLVRVNVTVLNRLTSQPVGDVKVQMIFDGPPAAMMTDRNGYFEISIPSRKTAQLTLAKDGFFTIREMINLETNPDTTRVIYIDPVKTNK